MMRAWLKAFPAPTSGNHFPLGSLVRTEAVKPLIVCLSHSKIIHYSEEMREIFQALIKCASSPCPGQVSRAQTHLGLAPGQSEAGGVGSLWRAVALPAVLLVPKERLSVKPSSCSIQMTKGMSPPPAEADDVTAQVMSCSLLS